MALAMALLDAIVEVLVQPPYPCQLDETPRLPVKSIEALGLVDKVLDGGNPEGPVVGA